LNEPVLRALLAITTGARGMLPLYHLVLTFVHENEELFGKDLVDAVDQTKNRVELYNRLEDGDETIEVQLANECRNSIKSSSE
jgi:hypothetical protein